MMFFAESLMPTRKEIQDRMQIKMGSTDEVLKGLLSPCAEVAEQIINEIWLNSKIEETEVVDGSWNLPFYCGTCKGRHIKRAHKFCPSCGMKIKWLHVDFIPTKKHKYKINKAV